MKYVEEENSWAAELHCHDEHEIERLREELKKPRKDRAFSAGMVAASKINKEIAELMRAKGVGQMAFGASESYAKAEGLEYGAQRILAAAKEAT